MQDLNQYRLARLEDIVPRLDAMIVELRADVKAQEVRIRWLERFFWLGVVALLGLLFKSPLVDLLRILVQQ